jgi:hypothetical protein
MIVDIAEYSGRTSIPRRSPISSRQRVAQSCSRSGIVTSQSRATHGGVCSRVISVAQCYEAGS